MKQLGYYIALALVAGGLTVAQAEANPYGVVSPPDWEYQALMTLVKHGAITDTKGVDLGSRAFTRKELIPMMADVVARRETMNESDRMLALRLYNENRRSIMNYEIEREEAKQGKAQVDSADEGIPIAVEPALTKEEIQKKMEAFQIDTSALPSRSGVQVRTSQQGSSQRSHLELVVPSAKDQGNVALQPIDGEVQEAMAGGQWDASKKEQQPLMKAAKQEWVLLQKKDRKQERLDTKAQRQIEKEQRKQETLAKKEQQRLAKAERVKLQTEQKLAKQQAKEQARLAKQQAKKEAQLAKQQVKEQERLAKQEQKEQARLAKKAKK
ncbi:MULTISPECIES: hypothetical protein [unclassified Veillonella]|uniref:hypothetical protein n=1 Tax=unclassified Veillonella TaxID=2630086 RepID=UPI000F8DD0C4|nr:MULTISPECIES: hypothetical protein [unclassified Veillonella]